ncbi:MAG: dihydropteroate synthase [Ignavibacteria bacterium]|nr:dihydropteroate synthase [Ignavibacteria bacterium]
MSVNNVVDSLIYKIGDKDFRFNINYIMGVVNVTPDSFSDGGKYYRLTDAVDKALKLIDDGADIIDIGGESSRPGSESINELEEIERVIPVIEAILKVNKNIVISVDTTKSNVARLALDKGALMVNDISAGQYDEMIFEVIASYTATVVLMHMKGNPSTMQINPIEKDVLRVVSYYLAERAKVAQEFGIDKIILDPGIGFGKTVNQNFELLRGLTKLNEIGYPVLVGVSKKSFLGKTFNLEINEREIPTLISEVISIINGAKIIRTHNVKNVLYAKKLIELAGNNYV